MSNDTSKGASSSHTNYMDLMDPSLYIMIVGAETVEKEQNLQGGATNLTADLAKNASAALNYNNTILNGEIAKLGTLTGSDDTEAFNTLQTQIGADTAVVNANNNNNSTDVNLMSTASGPTITQSIASVVSGLSEGIQSMRAVTTAIESWGSG